MSHHEDRHYAVSPPSQRPGAGLQSRTGHHYVIHEDNSRVWCQPSNPDLAPSALQAFCPVPVSPRSPQRAEVQDRAHHRHRSTHRKTAGSLGERAGNHHSGPEPSEKEPPRRGRHRNQDQAGLCGSERRERADHRWAHQSSGKSADPTILHRGHNTASRTAIRTTGDHRDAPQSSGNRK
jgi:hypothetical protein